MVYCPFGEYSGTTTKLGPQAKKEVWATVSGFLDKFSTHLALAISGVGIAVYMGIVVSGADMIVFILDHAWFEWPLLDVYMFLLTMLLQPSLE